MTYEQTPIPSLCRLCLYGMCLWGIGISSAPLVPSLLLISLLIKYLDYGELWNKEEGRPFLALSKTKPIYYRMHSIDKPFQAFFIQIYCQHRRQLRFFRHQFSDEAYKRLLLYLNADEYDKVWLKVTH